MIFMLPCFRSKHKPTPSCYQHLGSLHNKNNNNMKIFTINGVCGSGKTQAMIAYVSKHHAVGGKFIIAQPTIQLCQETAGFFLDSDINVQLITSDDRSGSTQVAYKRAISNGISGQKGCVIITTHRTFLDAQIEAEKRSHFNVFFDEVPQIDSTISLNLKHSHKSFFNEHFEVTPRSDSDELCDISIKVGHVTEIDELRLAGRQGKDLLYTDPALLQFMESMLDQTHANYVNKAKWLQRRSRDYQLIMHSVLKPDAFRYWHSCRLMGANIEDSMMHLIWPTYGVDFKPDPTKEFQLKTDHDDLQNRRISVYYFSGRDWSKYVRDEGGQVALDTLKNSVNELFGQQPSLVVTNNDIQGFDLHNSTRISNICHGINEHRDKHNILFFSALNDVPAHYGFLSRWQGIDSTALKKAKGMETMYQAVMRTSLRDKASTSEVKIVVPDINAANFLAGMLPNVKIQTMDSICDAWGESQSTRGRPTKEETASSAERAAKHRAAEAERKQANADALVKITSQYPANARIPVTWQESTYTIKHNLTSGMTDAWDDVLNLMQTASKLSYSDKARNSLINFVRFKADATTKGRDDIEYVHGIQLDFDGGALPWIDASELFSDMKHLTYNSFNNGKDGDVKFRIMIPFDTPVTCLHAELLWDVFKTRIESGGYYVGSNANKYKGRNSGLDTSKRPANSFYYTPSKAGKKEFSFFDTSHWNSPLLDVANALANWIPQQLAEYHEVAPVSNAGPELQSMLATLKKRLNYDDEAATEKRRENKIEKAKFEWQSSQMQSGQGHSALFKFALQLMHAGLNDLEAEQVIWTNMGYARSPAERKRELKAQIKSARKHVG